MTEQTETKELTVQEPKFMTFGEAAEFAKVAYASKLFPDAKSEAQAILKVMAGRELGITAFMSLNKLYIVNDKFGMAAEVAVVLLQRNGYAIEIQYDNRDNPTACEVTLRHTQKGSLTARFSLGDAARAGLVGRGGAWDKYPQDLLYARALMSAARKFAPEALGGMGYTKEELERIVEQPQSDSTKQVAPTDKQNVIDIPHSQQNFMCPVHNTEWFKRGKMKFYAHPIEGTDNGKGGKLWCSMDAALKELEPPNTAPSEANDAIETEKAIIDTDWLKDTLKSLGWTNRATIEYLMLHFEITHECSSVSQCLEFMTIGQKQEFVRTLESKLHNLPY